MKSIQKLTQKSSILLFCSSIFKAWVQKLLNSFENSRYFIWVTFDTAKSFQHEVYDCKYSHFLIDYHPHLITCFGSLTGSLCDKIWFLMLAWECWIALVYILVVVSWLCSYKSSLIPYDVYCKTSFLLCYVRFWVLSVVMNDAFWWHF